MAFLDRFRRNKNPENQDQLNSEIDADNLESPDFQPYEHEPVADTPEADLDINQTPEQVEQEAEEVAEKMLSEEAELRALIDEHFQEEFNEIKATYGEEQSEQAIEKIRRELLEKLQGKEAKTRLGRVLKKVAGKFTLGALAGAGLRSVIKNSARAYLGASSLGASVGLGALIGGGVAAFQTYRKEYEKVVSSDVLHQLDEALLENDNVKTAGIIDKARKELKNGKLFPLEANALKVKLQKAEIQLRLNVNQEKLENFSSAEKFLLVMQESASSRKELRKIEGVKHEKLKEKIEFQMQKNPEFRKKMVQNVLVGAAAGGLGGAAGYGMHALIDSEYVRELFGMQAGEKVAEKTTEKVTDEALQNAQNELELAPQSAQHLTENLGILQQEVVNAKTNAIVEKSQETLLEHKFTVAAEKGEGATHAARELLHDYLVNKEHMQGGSKAELTPEQIAKLIYTEDTLMKEHFLNQTVGAEHIVKPGQNFELTGAQIEAAWTKAQNLSPEQLGHITKTLSESDHNLSAKTLESFKSENLNNATNKFFDQIQESLKEKNIDVIKDNYIDSITVQYQIDLAIQQATDAQFKEFQQSKSTAFSTSAKVIAGLVTVGALGGVIWKMIKKKREDWADNEEVAEEKAEADQETVDEEHNESSEDLPEQQMEDSQERTFIFPRIGRETVSLTEKSEVKRKEFFNMNNVEIHASEFDGRRLSIEDLKNAGLEPIYDLKIGDTEIKLSQPYDLGHKRIAVTAYVREKENFVARSYYRSNSTGLWRYLPRYRSNGEGRVTWYDKVMSEEAITVPSEVQQALANISYDSESIKQVEDPNFLFAGTGRDLTRIAHGDKDGTIILEVSQTPVRVPGLNRGEGNRKIDPESLGKLDPEYKPFFGNKVAAWEQKSNLYVRPGENEGVVNVEVFESKNGVLRYMFCNDEIGRSWLAAIERTGPVKSTGLREEWVEGGDLVTPAYEYYSQADGYGNRKLNNGDYVDMYENYISKIPLIQEYHNYKNPQLKNSKTVEESGHVNKPEKKSKKNKMANQQFVGGPLKQPDINWSDALAESSGNKENLNQQSLEIKTSNTEPEAVEIPDVYDLNKESVERGLTAGQGRVWFDFMRADGGYLNSAAGEGKPLTPENVKDIQSVLRSIEDYSNSGKPLEEQKKAGSLVRIYEEILFPLRMNLEKDSDGWNQVDKIIRNLEKLTLSKDRNDFITQAEDMAARRLKTSRKKLGLANGKSKLNN